MIAEFFFFNIYYTDSIIFLADNVEIADISHFFADNMMFFAIWFQISKYDRWGSRRARGADRRPERGAKRWTEAEGEPRGPD